MPKLTMNCQPEVREQLNRLADETGQSLSEVLRRSLTLYDTLLAARKVGRRVIIVQEVAVPLD